MLVLRRSYRTRCFHAQGLPVSGEGVHSVEILVPLENDCAEGAGVSIHDLSVQLNILFVSKPAAILPLGRSPTHVTPEFRVQERDQGHK